MLRECPKCHGELEDDGSCSCGYGVKRRNAVVAAKQGHGLTGQICSWLDHGHRCPARGIISATTNGAGDWYCREHWLRLKRMEPEGYGNFPVTPSRRSAHMRQWDAWRYNPQTKRLEAIKGREPGSDDDLAELVPEEVGQA